MPQQLDNSEIQGKQIRLPHGATLKPPVTIEDLRRYTDNDPEGAEEFVELLRSLRQEKHRPTDL